jgi:uncharacterized membrane protein
MGRNQSRAAVPTSVRLLVMGAAIVLTLYSTTRHLLFHSTGFDLGYFDQAAYLISQGLPPVVSFWGYPFLGGHADLIMYPVALLYKIAPSVGWLFSIQAIALSIAGLPLWWLARSYGLARSQATTMVVVYLLQPIVFNINLFDFHPEVMAIPAIFGAILAARHQWFWRFFLLLGMTLLCRDSLSLNVTALGIWLLLFEKQRIYGLVALVMGASWFVIATQVIIPHFRPGGVEAIGRYGALGNSLSQILLACLTRPNLVIAQLLTGQNLGYFALLFAPVVWGLSGGWSWRQFAPLIPALPTLILNLLTTYAAQKDLVHQYSLPIVPFLMIAVMLAWREQKSWLRQPRAILLWSLLGFLCLAKYSYIVIRYCDRLDTWQATRTAIALVRPDSRLLTDNTIAPHLTHRRELKLTVKQYPLPNLTGLDEILISTRPPDQGSDPALIQQYLAWVKADRAWQLVFEQDGVMLFRRTLTTPTASAAIAPQNPPTIP